MKNHRLSTVTCAASVVALAFLLGVASTGNGQYQYSDVMSVGSVQYGGAASGYGTTGAQQTYGQSDSRVMHTGGANYGSVQYGSNAKLGGVTVVGAQGGSSVSEIQPGVYVIGPSGVGQSSGGTASSPPPQTVPTNVQVGNVTYNKYEGNYYEPQGFIGGRLAYRRTAPPVGTVVEEIPQDCWQELHRGRRYYNCGDVYYREKISRGRHVFVVAEAP